jgi:ABC-type nitrate/sulfonate/bicarbonate transport system permease component
VRAAAWNGRTSSVTTKVPPAAARLGVIAILLMTWQVAVQKFGDPLFVSTPWRAALALVHLAGDKAVMAAVGLTCWELVVAFALSAVIGIAVGLIVGLDRFTRGAIQPIILLLYATPQAMLLPLVILAYGIGARSKIAFGVSHGVFPIIICVAAGVQSIEPILLTSARSMGANRRQILFKVVLPHLVPSIFTGLRLGMTAVLFGVLLAELYVSQSGVGHFTAEFAQTFQPQKLFALVAILAGIAIVLTELCRRIELRFSRWRR